MNAKPANLSKNAVVAVAKMLVDCGKREIEFINALEDGRTISELEAAGRRIGVRGAVGKQLEELYYELASEKARDAIRATTSPGGVVGGGMWVLREWCGAGRMG